MKIHPRRLALVLLALPALATTQLHAKIDTPDVTLIPPAGIDRDSADCAAEVTDDYAYPVTGRGFVWKQGTTESLLEDFDGDTDTGDPASFFQAAVDSLDASTITIGFNSSAERRYTLQSSPDLEPGHWAPVAGQSPRPGTGGPDTMSAPITGATRFFASPLNCRDNPHRDDDRPVRLGAACLSLGYQLITPS